jgi:lysophospholipase L1-like esterase
MLSIYRDGLAMLGVAIVLTNLAWGAEPKQAEMPKVVLVGDSIRMSYAPFVIEALKDKAVVVSSPANGGDTGRVLAHLDEWVISEQPNIVHFNAGLHDLKRDRESKSPNVTLEQYEANLRKIIGRLQKETKATLIFATTTPIIDARHAKRSIDRFEADVVAYNHVGEKVAKEMGVEINDLHAFVVKEGAEKMIRSDGTHYSQKNAKKMSKVVVECVSKHLPSQEEESKDAVAK